MNPTALDLPVGDIRLKGNITIPEQSKGLVIFSNGSGSSRLSPKNNFLSQQLLKHGLSTLLFDILTPDESKVYNRRFDIDLLTRRLIEVTRFTMKRFGNSDHNRNIGYFSAGTGTASAIKVAEILGIESIRVIVSRGGRPDLAGHSLSKIRCPVLLIAGGHDANIIQLNEMALNEIQAEKQLDIIPGATHLFGGPGKLFQVSRLANKWFEKYIAGNKTNTNLENLQ